MQNKGNIKLIFIAAVIALGGLIFGFDTAVISGVTAALVKVYGLSQEALGFTVSIALIGTIAGAFAAGWAGDRFGRRDCLKVAGALFLFSALGCAFAWNWNILVISRFFGGLGIGASSVLAPIYLAEVSPAKLRGRFVAVFQMNIVGGILLAYLSNWIIGEYGFGFDAEWRAKLGIAGVPAIIFFAGLYFVPRSPRWLIKNGKTEEARAALKSIGDTNPQDEISRVQKSLEEERGLAGGVRLFQKKYAFPIFLAFCIAAFNQLSGINGLLYYINDIFAAAGFDEVAGGLNAVWVGLTNMVFTIVAMFAIDRFGRRFLLLAGAAGTSICMAAVAAVFFTGCAEWLLVWLLMGFIAFFAFSQGAVIWVYLSEIFPNAVRGKGQSLGSLTHWGFCAAISYLFPQVAALSKGAPFAFFAVMMALQFFTVLFFFPETKNASLEEIQKRFERR